MKHFCYLVLFSLLASCQYFEKRVPSEEELLQERLKQIDWKEVTDYPSVNACDSLMDKEQKKACFFQFLTELIQQKISTDSTERNAEIFDTLNVLVTVFPDASITFEPQFPSDSTHYNKAKVDSILKNRLTDFPKIEPAQKEGIPVKTQFILPVVLKAD
ncbi:MAG: hypothetical protein Q8K02_01510 [Flavobacterium sp.]|nr:hypothetical protein [Flavobacterium sp.]